MAEKSRATRYTLLGAVLGLSLLGTGCLSPHPHVPPAHNLPRELDMTGLPPHVIEPGNTLVMELRSLLLPKPPYIIRVLDNLRITIENGVIRQDITDQIFVVEPEGTLRLGGSYPTLKVEGMTLDQASRSLEKVLAAPPLKLIDPRVYMALEEGRELAPVPDSAIVRPDGTISLGAYGYIHIAGMTEQQARAAIEEHLAEFLVAPELVLEVATENYKAFYLIVQSDTGEEQIAKVPLAGNETVLDVLAASSFSGFPIGGDRSRLWIARPAPADAECDQILPIRWSDIVKRGRTSTNYQLLPGDRLYVQADPFLKTQKLIVRVTAPIEQLGSFAQNMLNIEELFRQAITGGGLFQGGLFGFGGFPGGGFGF